MKFIELGLSKSIITELEKMNYKEATKIQEMAIPHILDNKDIIGISQTGTGKTAAFALPIIEKLIRKSNPDKRIKVLVLSPTRELALQIRDNFRKYSLGTEFKSSVILGGVNQNSQIEVLKKGIDILIATPGRLLDLVDRNHAKLDSVEMLVLDEADTMLDMGFIRDIKKIVSKIPKTRQTLLFSATMSKEIKSLADDFLTEPITVKVNPENVTVNRIEQLLYFVDKKNKFDLLLEILGQKDKKTTLIFTRTKHGANKLGEQLDKYGISSSVIHGNKTQSNRVKALSDFKEGKKSVMIATDIAARGIDINELSQVINYDMPEHSELYVHRIGRTARAGLEGVSISLCSSEEKGKLKDIEKLIKKSLTEKEHNYPMLENNTEVSMKKQTTRNTSSKSNFKNSTNSSTRNNSSRGKSNSRPTSSSKSYGEKSTDSKPYARPNSSGKPYARPNGNSNFQTSEGKRSEDNKPYTKSTSSGKPYAKSNGGSKSYGSKNFGRPSVDNRRSSSRPTQSRGFKRNSK